VSGPSGQNRQKQSEGVRFLNTMPYCQKYTAFSAILPTVKCYLASKVCL